MYRVADRNVHCGGEGIVCSHISKSSTCRRCPGPFRDRMFASARRMTLVAWYSSVANCFSTFNGWSRTGGNIYNRQKPPGCSYSHRNPFPVIQAAAKDGTLGIHPHGPGVDQGDPFVREKVRCLHVKGCQGEIGETQGDQGDSREVCPKKGA